MILPHGMAHNKVIELAFLTGTTLNTGVPADTPHELLGAFKTYFLVHPNVRSARLGLVEFKPPGQQSIFSYVIGIDCVTGTADTISELKKISLSSPMGRWPVMIVPYQNTQYLFTDEAIIIYKK